MATGNDLNPCRVVDAEWRWVRSAGGYLMLQARKLVRDDQGRTEWTEWQDMPVVEV